MPVDQIEEALSQLDVGERALLDLSVHRGFDDDRIAALLGVDVSEVGALRRAALEKLFRIRAASEDGAREAVRDELRSVSDSTWIDPSTATSRLRSPGVIAAASILLVAAVIAAIALIAGGGGSGTASKDASRPAAPRANPSPANGGPQPSGVALQPLSPGAPGRVVASVNGPRSGQRLTVKLRGLPPPPGAYELWLYDSLLHSRSLGSVTAGSGSIAAALPRDASSYSWLDLSRQPGADRVHHSGESVFRTSLSRVLAGA